MLNSFLMLYTIVLWSKVWLPVVFRHVSRTLSWNQPWRSRGLTKRALRPTGRSDSYFQTVRTPCGSAVCGVPRQPPPSTDHSVRLPARLLLHWNRDHSRSVWSGRSWSRRHCCTCLTRPLGCVRHREPWNSARAALCYLWCHELALLLHGSGLTSLVAHSMSGTAANVRHPLTSSAVCVHSWTDTLHHIHRWPGADRLRTWAFVTPVCRP